MACTSRDQRASSAMLGRLTLTVGTQIGTLISTH
jgi:hypothetical protein